MKLKIIVDTSSWKWINIFAILQGHRLIWWGSTTDFDTGKNPLGQILFAGHSGLAGLSPLDLRQLQSSEIERTLSIFGRGFSEQEKIVLLAETKAEKIVFENLITQVTLDPKTD